MNSNPVNLQKLGLAKQVCKELPPIIEIVDRFIKDMEPYTYYHPVEMLLFYAIEYQILLQSNLQFQKKVYEKGVISSEEK